MGLYGMLPGPGINIPAVAAQMRATEESWMNGLIQIVDPNIGDGTFNPITNVISGGEPVVLWQGKARIQHMRAPQSIAGSFENSEIRNVRFKIPLSADIPDDVPIREGLQIYVVDGGEDRILEQYHYVVKSGINSSLAWNRTIETSVDLGAPQERPEVI